MAGHQGDVDEHLCPRCGAPFEPGQEYCLECGLRLEPGPGLIGALSGFWRERFSWYPGDWVWAVLLALLVAVIGGVVAVVLADSGRSGTNPLVADTDVEVVLGGGVFRAGDPAFLDRIGASLRAKARIRETVGHRSFGGGRTGPRRRAVRIPASKEV